MQPLEKLLRSQRFVGGSRLAGEPAVPALHEKAVLRTSGKGYVVLTNAASPKGVRIECKESPLKWKDGAEHFVSVIRGEAEIDALCSLVLNMLVQEVSEAGYQSIRERRAISLA